MIIRNLLLWVAGLLGFVGIIGIFIFIPIGIYFLVKAGNEQDLAIKKSKNKKGIIFIVLPFGMIVVGFLMLLVIHALVKS